MRFFLYLPSSEDDAKQTKQHPICQAICKEFSIQDDDIVIERIYAQQSISCQRLLKMLVAEKMHQGDTLVLTDLSSIGRDVASILDVLFFCFLKDINILCYHTYTRIEPAAESCMSFLITLQKRIDFHNLKSTRGKHRQMKKPLGRKEGSKHKSDIIRLKVAGYAQSKTAKILGISLSTVKRHWKNGVIG